MLTAVDGAELTVTESDATDPDTNFVSGIVSPELTVSIPAGGRFVELLAMADMDGPVPDKNASGIFLTPFCEGSAGLQSDGVDGLPTLAGRPNIFGDVGVRYTGGLVGQWSVVFLEEGAHTVRLRYSVAHTGRGCWMHFRDRRIVARVLSP
jgi:hypothetical protein